MWLLSLFIVSFLGVVVLLLAKMREMKTGIQNVVGRLLAKGDPVIRGYCKWLQNFANRHGERTFFLFLVHIPSRIEAFFSHLKNKSHDHYHGLSKKMRDRRDLSKEKSSTASPYMRSMPVRGDGEIGQI